MSRLTKTFDIEGYDKTFMVRELRVKEVLSIVQDDTLGDDLSLETMEKKFGDTFLPLCSNVTLDELKEMTPSEIMTIWDAFREVNASFFVVAKGLGFQTMIENLKVVIIEDFGKSVALSSNQDMLES